MMKKAKTNTITITATDGLTLLVLRLSPGESDGCCAAARGMNDGERTRISSRRWWKVVVVIPWCDMHG